LFNRMNCKLKQVAVSTSRASKSLFQESSSSSSRREAMLRCVYGEEEQRGEEEEQRGKEEQGGEEERRGEEEEEVELEHLSRQTRMSHVVAPPIAPAWEEYRVLIMLMGDR
jgi:hypothetical protein